MSEYERHVKVLINPTSQELCEAVSEIEWSQNYRVTLEWWTKPETPNTPPCAAVMKSGTPVFSGPHDPHLYTYGPHNEYTGSCIGRTHP